jgi:hypothetical protein
VYPNHHLLQLRATRWCLTGSEVGSDSRQHKGDRPLIPLFLRGWGGRFKPFWVGSEHAVIAYRLCGCSHSPLEGFDPFVSPPTTLFHKVPIFSTLSTPLQPSAPVYKANQVILRSFFTWMTVDCIAELTVASLVHAPFLFAQRNRA